MNKNSRPKVLLIGNGFNLLVKNNVSNEKLIEALLEIYKKPIRKKDRDELINNVPWTLLTMIALNDGKESKAKKVKEQFYEKKKLKLKYNSNPILHELLNVGFDAILTTNYTYECETVLDHEFIKNKDKRIKTNNIYKGKNRKESKYLLKTYNQIVADGFTHNIWHIHGELRNKNSLVYGLPDYNGLITKIFNYISNDLYQHKNKISYESWIDYFVYGDVYILGNNLSFYEYDLWQLLYTKKNLNNHGNTIFYEQKEKDNRTKYILLNELEVEVKHMNFTKKHDDKEFDYSSFYKKAIKDIKKQVK